MLVISFNSYSLPIAMNAFLLLLDETRQHRDNGSHSIKAVLAPQFLKVLPCDSLINQTPYLNLAGSKSNKLRLSEKNTCSRHPYKLAMFARIPSLNLHQFENTIVQCHMSKTNISWNPCPQLVFSTVQTSPAGFSANVYLLQL